MAIRSVDSTLPVATTFTNAKGQTVNFFLRNNPWKVFAHNNSQKIFLYCIICGDARFSADEWSAVARSRLGSTTTCHKDSCWKIDPSVSDFIPRKHYMIVTAHDKSRTQGATAHEFFEQVNDATSLLRSDKVYSSEDEMPREYIKDLTRLEDVPIKERIHEIDLLYFSYAEKNNIPLGKTMMHTNDPFLKVLAEYRQQVNELLLKL